LEAWSSMSPADRENFTFNYDALDVLIDSTYSGRSSEKYQYDDAAANYDAAEDNKATYSLERPVDYTATYKGTEPLSYNGQTLAVGATIDRVEYEAIPNEQYHYSSFIAAANVYVVKKNFVVGETPYSVGQTITEDTYNSLGANQNDVDILTFSGSEIGQTFYYCRNSYVVNEHGEGQPVKAVKATSVAAVGDTKTNGQTVPVGFIISENGEDGGYTYGYKSLVNKQLHFDIHGVAPVETSTLYVSRNSDIYDLSKEKIITVIYQYDYEESDDTGMHITPVSERHIVNIHLQFKSGIPTVETITAPDLVLPGTNVVIKTPTVTPGAYEVLGGGWEIYRNSEDAESHRNGVPYSPSTNPLYWYQDGYHVAYYAKTYLGKTYSNAVPVSVANYHDLKKVMDDKQNHYYVDNNDVKRDPKIYINNYATDDPATSQNGLTLLKDFFALTQHQKTYSDPDHDGIETPDVISSTSTDPLYNHVGIDRNQIGDCKNLEFFLRTDLSAPTATGGSPAWTSIGKYDSQTPANSHCFEGILHGDGHVISGLDHSLFENLCGEVYNLGVTGTFTSAGIVDNGTGYLENCWVKSDDNTAKTDKPVFNNPINPSGENARTVHMVNCYYPEENQYTDHDAAATYGLPTEKPLLRFYNGEVTYDLNEFYLFKRYCDNNSSVTGNDYSYWKDVNGTLTKQTGHYASVEGPYLMNDANNHYVGSYVESRFADGDFVYAAGSIPGSADKRYHTTDEKYYPIWPDDYIFFGQTLTYGHVAARAHQALPAPINKNVDRLPNASTSGISSNRVYRAPAYYRSSAMGMAHFNPDVVLAKTKNDDATVLVHKNMTAIDFTGGNGDLAGGYEKGLSATRVLSASPAGALTGSAAEKIFYPPLLDDDGIFSMQNIDLTRNLLVYTGTTGGTGTGETPNASQQTANVVSAYLLDQAYVETDANYHTVDAWDSHSDNVLGHWVQGNNGTYTALRDHFLIDKQDFNAPIGYTFTGGNSGKRMWYQRTPDTYVEPVWSGDPTAVVNNNRSTNGWEGISLPFQVEMVTTQDKGELTHFYNGSNTSHEYWLRQFVTGGSTTGNVYTANFDYPAAGSNEKDYTNTFLWDYYYKFNTDARQDKNSETYWQTYYSAAHTYSDYPYSVAGTPYIIGFPGSTFYEFDLSGTFIPSNTHENQTVAQLAKQTVTFASPIGTTIRVSDTETVAGGSAFGGSTYNGYTFTPNYLGKEVEAGVFKLNNVGNSYVVTDAASDLVPFRPYFTYSSPSGGRSVKTITFSSINTDFGINEQDNSLGGDLHIKAKKRRIIVESTMRHPADVVITNAAGVTVATFTIQPGETVETPINATGIYIVNNKKLRVEGR